MVDFRLAGNNSVAGVVAAFGLFLVGAGHFAADDGYRWGVLILALLGLTVGSWQAFSVPALRVLLLCLLYPLTAAAVIIWQEGWGSRSSLYVTLIACVPVFWALQRYQPDPAWFFRGAALAAVLAFGWAMHDMLWLHRPRAAGFMNAIKFGNTALLFGLLSLIGASLAWREHRCREAGLLTLACAAGLTASLLSGTRGGWLVFPVLAVVLILWSVMRHGLRSAMWLLLAMLLLAVLVVVVNPAGVMDRMTLAWQQMETYDPANKTSIGQRINMWLLSVELIKVSPWLGLGGDGFVRELELAANSGKYVFASDFNHPHNDVLNAWVKHGVFVAVALLSALLLPLGWHATHLAGSGRCQAIAMAGVIVSLCYVVFGLTQVMIGSKSATYTYFGLMTVCLALATANASPRHQAAQQG